ncbi:hypothetical protein KC19_3G182600 [Ceratodon purpureus]|uniref:Uncharacterized protein n=1 Tax=Ceratodon purpureus TaxID=3225 RepID=A0A8T0IJW9_CERPU|nr:hypothetical protein KC19_3G182600 [Ceratodon purpureus]
MTQMKGTLFIVDHKEVSLHGWIMGCYSTIELQASHRDSWLCGLRAAFFSN